MCSSDLIPEAFAIGGRGRLVTPESVPELAAAMRAEFAAPRPSASDREALHERVHRGASIEKLAAETLALYRRLSNSQPPGHA